MGFKIATLKTFGRRGCWEGSYYNSYQTYLDIIIIIIIFIIIIIIIIYHYYFLWIVFF